MSVLPLGLLMFALLTFSVCLLSRLGNHFILCANGDSDMKIFGSGTPAPPRRDAADTEAAEYTHHKQSGNIDIAKEVGKQLGLLVSRYTPSRDLPKDMPDAGLQCSVLYLYAAYHCAEESSASDIVSKSIQQSLTEQVQAQSPDIQRCYNDLGAFTLYKMAMESPNSLTHIGETFAKQCGVEGNSEWEELGKELYKGFVKSCEAICDGVTYCK